MKKTIFICDHCGKEMDNICDFTDMKIDNFINFIEVDLCSICFYELDDIVMQYCNKS